MGRVGGKGAPGREARLSCRLGLRADSEGEEDMSVAARSSHLPGALAVLSYQPSVVDGRGVGAGGLSTDGYHPIVSQLQLLPG